jgi:hypothetical protein
MAIAHEVFTQIQAGRSFPYLGIPEDWRPATGVPVIYAHCAQCEREIRIIGCGGWLPEWLTCTTCWEADHV